MYHVPAAPQTHVTREIVCICCNERFTIAIDTPDRKKGHHKSDKWHVPANQISTTILRFTPHSHQQMINPPGRAEPENDPEQTAHHDQDKEYYINCPRCGADNRNWLNAQTHKFPHQKPFWIGAGLVSIISIIAFLFFYKESGRLPFSLGLGGAVFAVGLIPLFIIPSLWSDYRLRNYLNDVAPDAPEGTTPQWKAAFTIWGFFLMFVFVLMLLRPIRVWVADLFLPELTPVAQLDTLIANSQELNNLYEGGNRSVIHSYTSLANTLNQERQYAACNNANLEERVAELEAARDTEVNMFAFALERLKTIPDDVPAVCQKLLYIEIVAILKAVEGEGLNDACLQPTCNDTFARDTIAEIEAIIASMPDPPAPYSHETAAGRNQILAAAHEKLIASNTQAAVPQITENVRALNNTLLVTSGEKPPRVEWIILISLFVTAFLSWYSGTSFGIHTMRERAEKIDSQLPRPIYSDLTNMTRLAIWELKKSLEAETYIDQVQWMEASHDASGGLILIGLHRGLPEFNAFGMRTGNTIRAQRYEIRTNRWVRVISAKIEDVEVPSTIDTPDLTIDIESWPREAENGRNQPEPAYNSITPGNRGYVINGESASRQSERSPQAGSTAVSTPNVTPYPDEPVPPPLYFRAGSGTGNTATHSAGGDLTLAQISQLSRKICSHFSENELRSLCLDLDVYYDSLPGHNKREKTGEMIRHFSQRGQINDLLRVLRLKRPNFNWHIMG